MNIVIIGGTKGLGMVISKTISNKSDKLIITYNRDEFNATAALNELKKINKKTFLYQVDISDLKSIEHLKYSLTKRFGQIHILINNVGINQRERLSEITENSWNEIINTNLTGTFWTCKLFGEHMFENKTGSIVNISSTAGIKPFPKSYHYVAAKSGIISLTKALAKELSPFVRINSVAPGYIESPGKKKDLKLQQEIPLKRYGKAIEIAKTVSFIAKDATYITGQTIVVDGGMTL
ncbi:MAG: 3-oxoacyl-[acyl-carrier-protein] reductase FabG [Bacteroidia bacterium]|nr:3-oxoacyl-[acyl-carrier-protein] reductase FabG [Bacteroidia bacterium]